MSFDLEQMLRSKKTLRERLARLPIGEKLRLLDAMRERAVAIRGVDDRQRMQVQEQPSRYGKEP